MDRRIQYTKKVVKESFLTLLEEKPVSEITVTELCQKADINRGTFYTHYLDIFNLYETIIDELLQSIVSELECMEEDICHEPVYNVLEIIYKDKDLFFTIVKWEDNDSLLERLFVIFHKSFTDMISKSFKVEYLKYVDYCYQFIVGGSIAVLTNWITNGYKADKKEVADCLITLTHFGFGQYLKEEIKTPMV